MSWHVICSEDIENLQMYNHKLKIANSELGRMGEYLPGPLSIPIELGSVLSSLPVLQSGNAQLLLCYIFKQKKILKGT